MMHKAWCSIEEVPYCFPRPSIKFQGHKGQKIDLDQIWARLLGRSQLSNPSDLPCSILEWMWPGDTTWHQRYWSTLVQVMAYRLLEDKPFPDAIFTYCCQSDHWEQTSVFIQDNAFENIIGKMMTILVGHLNMLKLITTQDPFNSQQLCEFSLPLISSAVWGNIIWWFIVVCHCCRRW